MRQAVLDAIDNYEKYIEQKGIELPVLEAYAQVVKDVYRFDKDPEYGKKVSRMFKDHLNKWVRMKTGGGFWQLETYEGGQGFKEVQIMYEVLKEEAFYDFESYICRDGGR